MNLRTLIQQLQAIEAEHCGELPVAVADHELGGFREPGGFDVQMLHEWVPEGGWFDYSPCPSQPADKVNVLSIY